MFSFSLASNNRELRFLEISIHPWTLYKYMPCLSSSAVLKSLQNFTTKYFFPQIISAAKVYVVIKSQFPFVFIGIFGCLEKKKWSWDWEILRFRSEVLFLIFSITGGVWFFVDLKHCTFRVSEVSFNSCVSPFLSH